MKFLKRIYYKLIKRSPADMPMVQWWKTQESVEAKLTSWYDRKTKMVIGGEAYSISGFPRSHILVPNEHNDKEAVTLAERIEKHGAFSVLKHEIKNQVFNQNWYRLEAGASKEEVISEVKRALREITEHLKPLRYDLMPPESMCSSVAEIHRAWTKVAPTPLSLQLRDILTLILQEDDSYRYRVEWLATWIPFIKINPVKILDKAFIVIEHAEVLGDMKERIRLLRRIVMLALEDPRIRDSFIKFFKEVNWKKVKLTKGGAYHFRGKYFKVDYGILEY